MSGSFMERKFSKTEDRIKAELCFSRIPWIGPAIARRLMERFGGPEKVLSADASQLFKLKGMSQRLLDAFRNAPSPEAYAKEAEWLMENGVRTWLIGELEYPTRLAMCPDAPVLLFGRGDMELEGERMLSIVGTRSVTPYGERICRELVAGLAPFDVTIVSGLAFGVDIRAHRAAMKAGLPTIAVAGHGMDRVYPMEHERDLQEMLGNGGMVSEFPMGSQPERHHFPRRNRIVAGSTDCTVVVETGPKGGAMITANIAHSYEREVLAFPGRVGDPRSSGCNRLIKDHKAALIEGVEDLIHQMHWEGEKKQKEEGREHQRELFLQDLNEDEKRISRIVEEEGRISLDALAHRTDIPVGNLSPMLLDLELKGVLNALPGKIYVRADR